MRDHQVFEEKTLANGIRTFWYADESRFTQVNIIIPIGSTHNTGAHVPGTFHFLEHAICLRSKLYPAYKEFDHLVSDHSGTLSASIDQTFTTFGIEIPTKYLDIVLPGLFSALFEPIFEEADLAKERTVIAAEREGRRTWFPCTDEIGHYLSTEWMDDCALSLRQRLGEDEDLDFMTADYLRERLPLYRHSQIRVIGGGSGDISPLLQKMSALTLTSHALASEYRPLVWKNPVYRVQRFRDQGTYDLLFEGLESQPPSWERYIALRFALLYLCESDGPLMHWLRDDLGWAYNVWDVGNDDAFGRYWGLAVSLVSLEQVEVVRAELPGHIQRALEDSEALKRYYQRRVDDAETYWYQRLGTILEDGVSDLTHYDQIYSEKEYLEFSERCADPEYLQEIWKSFDRPETTGWLCTAPLEENSVE